MLLAILSSLSSLHKSTMKFQKIIYSGTKKTAYGHDDTGAAVIKEFPASMSDSEIFKWTDPETAKESEVKQPEPSPESVPKPEPEPKPEPSPEPENTESLVDENSPDEKPKSKSKK